MYVTVCPSLSPSLLLAGRSQDALETCSDSIQPFRYGREALQVGLGVLGIKPRDIVLVPASMCDVVLSTLVKLGIAMRYYDLGPSLAPDAESLEAGLRPGSVRAVYVNHYFGLPVDFSGIRRLCNERGIALIEDCAHALPITGSRVGTWGDIAIFSPRKLLPLPDGGLLKLNSSRLAIEHVTAASPAAAATLSTAKLLAADFARRSLLPVASLKRWRNSVEVYLATPPSLGDTECEAPRRMSRMARFIASRCDVSTVADARRRHYGSWQQWTRTAGLAGPFAPELPAFAIPYSFPLATADNKALIRAAAARGLYLEPTLTAPYRNVPGLLNPAEPFPVAERLASRLVSLPIHQSLESKQLRRMESILDGAACMPYLTGLDDNLEHRSGAAA